MCVDGHKGQCSRTRETVGLEMQQSCQGPNAQKEEYME